MNICIKIYQTLFDASRDVIFFNDQDELILFDDFNIIYYSIL